MTRTPQDFVKFLIEKGYTEDSIAKKAKISQSTVNRIKAGHIQYPRCNIMLRLEKIYESLQ